MQGKPIGVLNRFAGSGSMPSKIINKGSFVNTSKLVRELNRLFGDGAMLVWYQGKPIEVLNRLTSRGAIPGKRDIINTLLCIWLNQTKTPSAYIYS